MELSLNKGAVDSVLERTLHGGAAVAMALLPAVLLAGALDAQEVVDLPEEDQFPVLDLDEVYRVGGSDLLLSRVRKAEFGGDGTLYILDGNSASSARLLAIRDDGQTAVQLGEPGDGPGEFSGLPHFAPLGDRHVAAFDWGQNAYLVFSSDGALVRTVGAGGDGRVAGLGNLARVVRPDRARNGLLMVNPLNRTTVSRGSAGESGRAAILRYYHEVPVVEGVKAGWDRSVWVQRRNPAHLLSANIVDDYVPGPVDLLLATGDYVGTFDPSDLPMPMALGPDGLAAFLELDALEVPTVVVRRLPTELR